MLHIHENGQSDLNEVGQTTKLLFALLNEEQTENITPLIRCKDYFSDIIYVQNNRIYSIKQYGFEWDYASWWDKASHIPLLLSMDDEAAGNFSVDFLHKLEDFMGIERSTYTSLKDVGKDPMEYIYNNFVTLVVSKDWFSNAPLFSLYTLLVRLFCSFPYKGESTLLEYLTRVKKVMSPGHTDLGLVTTLIQEYTDMEILCAEWRRYGTPHINSFSEDVYDELKETPEYEDELEDDFSYYIHEDTGIRSFLKACSSNYRASASIESMVTIHKEIKK